MIPRTKRISLVGIIALLGAISAVILSWAVSYHLVMNSNMDALISLNLEDLSAILFGASSVALVLVSLAMALAAVFGWQAIQGSLEGIAKKTAEEMKRPLEIESKGRTLAALGYMRGEMSIDQDLLEVRDKDGLADAIGLCEQGHKLLKEIGGGAEIMVLNNLIYYYCIAGDKGRREFLVKGARRLMEAGQDRDVMRLQLTACRAILQFGKEKEEKRKVYEALVDLSLRSDISERERKEARRYRSLFSYIP